MTNRSSSKQHGLVGNIRPVKTLGKKKNKALARKRKEGFKYPADLLIQA